MTSFQSVVAEDTPGSNDEILGIEKRDLDNQSSALLVSVPIDQIRAYERNPRQVPNPVHGELLLKRLLATDITRDKAASSRNYSDQHSEWWTHDLFLPEYYDLRNHERDNGYSNAGTLPVFFPGRWQSRKVCGQDILGEWFRSIVLQRDGRVEYMGRFLPPRHSGYEGLLSICGIGRVDRCQS